MRILVLSAEPPYPPTFGGARLRLYHLLRELSGKHEFTLLSLLEWPEERADLAALEPFCRQILAHDGPSLATPPILRQRLEAPFYRLAYSPEFAATVTRQLSTANWDLVHVDTARMAVYTPLLRGQRKLMSAVDSATLGYRNRLLVTGSPGARFRAWVLYRLVRRFERQMYRQYDACTVVADRDAAVLRQLCPKLPVEVIPNGVEIPAQAPASSSQNTLVFTGTMDYGPNIDAMVWFVNQILPLIRATQPAAKLQIVGRNPTPAILDLARFPGVEVTGYVPDVGPYLAAATVFVCPLREGSGMKNKVLEAMAAGKATVTTAEGASGIDGLHDREFLVANEAVEFSRAVARLLETPSLGRRLGAAARQFVMDRFSWLRTAESLDRLYWKTAQIRTRN